MAGKKIRDDLEGVTFVYVDDQPIELRAGDEVPKGAKVGDHLLTPKAAKDTGGTPASKPATEQTTPAGEPSGEKTPDSGSEPDPSGPPPAGDSSGDALTPPDGRSSRDAWVAWAKHVGVEHAEDATKDDIRTAVAAATQQQ
ncbi:MAG: hypothetical protein NVV66_18335 [Cellulomonas sp.]|uniref:hypothetical protein n=1 Tax=Cellulomonas sp. TaxID=40001 RepID=UPI00258A3E3D|nr:hypothetical protein [Cellulomonas sp.]MCR6706556.1 hypothetical protein [Cellulomonas sp.]